MITSLIFDMDGVLVDSEPTHKRIEQQLYQQVGLHISYQEHMSMVGMSSQNTWAMLKKKYGFMPSVSEMVKRKKDTYRNILANTNEIPLVEGVKPVLQKLAQKYTLSVASSSSLENITIVLEKYALKKYFSKQTSGQEVPYSKPKPDIFLLASERISTPPKNCLVIEDAANGVKAAKSAGMWCIGFQNPNSGTQDLSLADKIVHHYQELEQAIYELTEKSNA